MRLFGSLNNRLMEASKQPEPVVGMGITECCWSDRHAYTIVEVISPKKIVVRQDEAKRVDSNGMSDSQKYEYSPGKPGNDLTLSLRAYGWRRVGSNKSGNGWLLDCRDEHYDFSF